MGIKAPYPRSPYPPKGPYEGFSLREAAQTSRHLPKRGTEQCELAVRQLIGTGVHTNHRQAIANDFAEHV